MTNEEAILGLREIKEAKIIPSYIEEPMGIEGIAVDTDKMFDLAIKALEKIDKIENLKEPLCEDYSIKVRKILRGDL